MPGTRWVKAGSADGIPASHFPHVDPGDYVKSSSKSIIERC